MKHKIKFMNILGLMLVEATLNGQKGLFAFDTGSSIVTLNSRHYQQPDDDTSKEIITFDGEKLVTSTIGGICKVDSILLGDKVFRSVKALTFDLGYVEEQLLQATNSQLVILGTLGCNFFKNKKFMIDYINEEITFNPSVKDEEYVQIDFLHQEILIIETKVDNHNLNMIVDTGATQNILNDKLDFEVDKIMIGEKEYLNQKFFKFDLSSIQEKLDIQIDGIIGIPILSLQTLIFDFRNNKILLYK